MALVSRYFGPKKGLFEATVAGAFDTDFLDGTTRETLPDRLVSVFTYADRSPDAPSVLDLLLTNAADAEVGPMIRDQQKERFTTFFDKMLGNPDQAAMLMVAIMGFAVVEKTLKLDAIAAPDDERYAKQLRHLIEAALNY